MNEKDGISAIALIALGLFAVIKGLQLPVGTLREPGTSFFPILLSSLLILLSLALLRRSIWVKQVAQGGARFGEYWKSLIIFILTFVAYAFLVAPVGYILTTVSMILVVARLANCSWKEAAWISVVCTVGSYILIVNLNGNLPKGVLPF